MYREAILQPAARANPPITVDERLAERLIDDTAAESADPLPLLAFTMERLYRRFGQALHTMELKHYEALGGLTGSIDAAITEAFSEPNRVPVIPAERADRERLLEAAFIPALADINPVNGEPLSRLGYEHEIDAGARNLIDRLVDAHLLVSDKAEAAPDGVRRTTFRVAHEALLRRWNWLNTVLKQQTKNLSTVGIVERQAETWDKAERSDSWLDLRGERLQEALSLRNRDSFKARLNGLSGAYLAACQTLERAATWRRRRGYALGLMLLAALVTAAALRDRWLPIVDVAYHTAENWMTDLTKRGTTFKDCFDCPVMVAVPAGKFMMGSPVTETGRGIEEDPQREVTIAAPFAVGQFEVTFAQWDACVDAGGCKHKPSDSGWGERESRPVINVSWEDAKQYVKWLSENTGQTYRLLSEAEWEYAARAGKTTVYSWGDDVGQGNANCEGCGSEWDNKKTAPVGQFKANAFGLHDMHGNVWEWVEDCYGHYEDAPRDGSSVPDKPDCARIFRGGAWGNDPGGIRAAIRDRFRPDGRYYYFGFRVARDLFPARTP